MSDRLVITIGRSHGSGGRALAKKLSDSLGLPYYDRQILHLAAEATGINEELFGHVDEQVRGIFLSAQGRYKGHAIPPNESGSTRDDNLFELQADVIRQISEVQNCIFVGRCVDYILRDRDYVVSLFLYASEEDCLKRLRKRESGSDAALLKKKRAQDQRRADYYRYYTGREWNNPENYDLCINTGTLEDDKIIEVIKSYITIR